MYRIYRDGKRKNAWAHGNYIRPIYSDVWHTAERMAKAEGVSLSEYTSHALFVFMTGHEPVGGKLRGRNAFSTKVKEMRNDAKRETVPVLTRERAAAGTRRRA